MWNEDKVNEKIDKIKDSLPEIETREISLSIPGKPESYSRERKGRGKHFYNPKSGEMSKFRKTVLRTLTKEEYCFCEEARKDENTFVSISAIFFCPIPKGDSIKTAALKELRDHRKYKTS